MYALLDGAAIRSREELHDALARQLSFPDYYGRNLDALYDCLTELLEPTETVVRHADALFAHLGMYAEILRSVLRDAAEDNPDLRVTVEEAPCEPEGWD